MRRSKGAQPLDIDLFDQSLPVVAIVGRPNVGKSTLFNRLTGTREAVVIDTPGVTRDRHYGEAEWLGRRFRVVDTGGFAEEDQELSGLLPEMREQVLVAINEAHAVIFLLDAAEPDNPVDRAIAEILRRSDKPAVVGVNKCESLARSNAAWELAKLGLGEVYPMSALHGGGAGDMLDALLDLLPPEPEPGFDEMFDDEDAAPPDESDRPIRLAIVGRQNAGKSTLVNRLLGSERVIASPVPGTTRDSIDTAFTAPDGRRWVLVDTAGIRRRGKIEKGIEGISVLSALMSMERADVVVLLIDAEAGLADQDKHIAGYAIDRGCGVVIGVNKWDAVEKDGKTADQFTKDLREQMPFIGFAPVLYMSGLTGQRAEKLWELAERVYLESCRRIETPRLNEWLGEAMKRFSPPVRRNRQFKANYVTQTGVLPPTFTIFCNDPRLVHFSYQRYLVNTLREAFGLNETPIRLRFKRKSVDRKRPGEKFGPEKKKRGGPRR